jgi:hypothetical protein
MATALFLITLIYLVLDLATLAKIRFMHTAVQPLDVRLPELPRSFTLPLGTAAAVALTMALLL